MDDHDLEQRLRESGASVRATAPDSHEVAAALTTVARRRPSRRWVAPAALVGVAAGVVGLLVWLARPSDEADQLDPADAPPATAMESDSTAVEHFDTGTSVDKVNWDGRGGRCVTIATGGDRAVGCIEGDRIGFPLTATVGPSTLTFWLAENGETVPPHFGTADVCGFAGVLDRGRIYEQTCDDEIAQIRQLPTTPTREFTPIVPRELPYEFEPIRVDGVSNAAAYISRPLPGSSEQCLVLVVDGRPGWREACDDFADGDRLAVNVGGALWIVEVSSERVLIASAATSASVHGCTDSMTEILTRLDRASMADVVACSGTSGLVTTPRLKVSTWLQLGSRSSIRCFGTSVCGGRGDIRQFDPPLPIAPGSAYRPPTDEVGVDDLTGDIGAIDIPPGADAAEIGNTVGRHYQDPGEPPGSLIRAIDVIDERLLVLVEVAVLDDAAGPETYAVWLDDPDDTDGALAIDRLFQIRTCARGLDAAGGRCV
jgi:hypothetical protein